MGAPPEIVAFHVGIVVRDLHAVMNRYKRMFAIEHWHLRDPQPGIPLRIAYGGRRGRHTGVRTVRTTRQHRRAGRDAAGPAPTPAGLHRRWHGHSALRADRASGRPGPAELAAGRLRPDHPARALVGGRE